MRKLFAVAIALAMAGTAFAAPNVTNVTQKGSLLVFPDIRIDDGWNTLVRLQNDGSLDVDVLCYWMDGNKNRVDFIIPLTRNQAIWFDARTGIGSYQVNTFPQTVANGIDNPFLVTTGAATVQPGGVSDQASPDEAASRYAALTTDVLFGRLDLRGRAHRWRSSRQYPIF
jgi:hypothetical protein